MPLLSSFPAIFEMRRHNAKTTSVRSTLTVTSSIGEWVRGLEASSRLRIGFDEREEISNGLKTIREVYASNAYDEEDDDWDD